MCETSQAAAQSNGNLRICQDLVTLRGGHKLLVTCYLLLLKIIKWDFRDYLAEQILDGSSTCVHVTEIIFYVNPKLSRKKSIDFCQCSVRITWEI